MDEGIRASLLFLAVLKDDNQIAELEPALRTALVRVEDMRVDLVWAARLALEFPFTPQQAERVRHAVEWRVS